MGSKETPSNQSDLTAVKMTLTNDSSPVLKFDISLQPDDGYDDDGEYSYRPGGQLTGDVVLVLAAPMYVSSIVVELRGEATVAWKVDLNHDAVIRRTAAARPVTNSRWYQACELYIDDRHDILLGVPGDLLQPGEHRFPVSFQLPRGLPSSFRGRFGGVAYILRANFVDKTPKKASTLATGRYVVSEPVLVRRVSVPPPGHDHVRSVTVTVSRRLFAAAPFVCASGLLRVEFMVADGITHLLGDDIQVRMMDSQCRIHPGGSSGAFEPLFVVG